MRSCSGDCHQGREPCSEDCYSSELDSMSLLDQALLICACIGSALWMLSLIALAGLYVHGWMQ